MSLFDVVASLSLDTTAFEKGINGAKTAAKGIGTGLKTAGKLGVAALTGTTAAVGAFAKSAVSAGTNFDSSMSQVAATSGMTMEELEQQVGSVDTSWGTFNGNLREYAQFMGSNTAFSATEAADALNYMALAGYDAQTSMDMLPNVLNLASAGGMDLASASDMITDSQTALGLSLDETSDMVDQMALASSKSNTSVSQLGEAFLTIGATARNVKGGTTELSTVLGALADNGIKGSEAGTHLRNMILSLQNPTKDAMTYMEEMGLSVYDSEGNMRSLTDIIGDMQTSMEGMDQESKDAIVSGIFNRADMASVNALLGTSQDRFDELSNAIKGAWYTSDSLEQSLDDVGGISLSDLRNNVDKLGISQETFDEILNESNGDAELFKDMLWDASDAGVSEQDVIKALGGDVGKLQKAFDGTSGAADKMSKVQLNNLQGDVTLFKSALEGAQIAVSDELTPTLRKFVSFGTSSLSTLTEAFKDGGLTGAMDALGTILSEGLTMLIEGLPSFIDAGMQLLGAVGQGIIENLPTIITAAVDILTMLLQGLAENIPMVLDGALTILLGLVQGITENIPTLLPAIIEIVTAIPRFLAENADVIVQAGIDLFMALVQNLPEIIQGLVEAVGQIVVAIIIALGELVNHAPEIFKEIWESIKKIFKDLPKWFKDIFTKAWKKIKDAWSKVGEWFKNLWNGIKNTFSKVGEWFKGIFQGAWDGIKNIWSAVTGWFTEKWNGIKNIFASVPTWFKDKFKAAWTNVKSAFSAFKDFFKGLWTGIKNTFASVPTWFKDKFKAAWQKVKDVFSKGGKVFEGIKDGIVSAFKSVVNAIIRGINKVIKIPFDAINGVFRKLKGISILGVKPFGWLNEFSVPQIPELARGGILKRGEVGLLEGTGAEAVVPLENNREWVRKVAEDMADELGTTGGGTVITMNIYGAQGQDVNELAELVTDKIARQMARRKAVFA